MANWPMLPRLVPIPNVFQSLEHDGPFTQCLRCECRLREDGREYFIERVFRGSEPIIEYAVCLQCHEAMCEELSEASRQSIDTFFRQHADFERRLRRLEEWGHRGDVDDWIGECLLTNTKRSECREYQVIAFCRGEYLELGATPFMISGEAVESLSELLSEQTRGWLEDFLGNHFGMPPEFCEPPSYTPILL